VCASFAYYKDFPLIPYQSLFSQVSSTRLLRSLSRCYATKALAVWRSAKYRQQKSHGLVSKLTSMTFSLSYLAKSLLHVEVSFKFSWMRNLSHFSTFFTFHRDEVLDEVFWEYAASGKVIVVSFQCIQSIIQTCR